MLYSCLVITGHPLKWLAYVYAKFQMNQLKPKIIIIPAEGRGIHWFGVVRTSGSFVPFCHLAITR